MQNIIVFIQHCIHEDYFDNAEDWLVERTSPLYKAIFFLIIGLGILIVTGTYANVQGYKNTNIFLWIISVITILLILLYGRYIFRIAAAGTAYGALTTGVSGLEGGMNLLNQYLKAGKIMIMIITGIFGVLSFIEFSWASAGICLFVGIMIGLSNLQ